MVQSKRAFGLIWAALSIVGSGSGCGSSNEGNDSAAQGSETGDSGSEGGPGGSGSGEGETSANGSDEGTGSGDADADSGDESGMPDDVEVIELRAGGFSPPAVETWYSCFSFTVELDQLAHIVGFVAKVESPIVHHYVLSIADGAVQTDPNSQCFEWPAQILWAWSPGIESTMLPPEAGFLIGDAPGGQHTFVLQVHYNDPLGEGLVDNSGIDLLVTKNLREHDAGMFSQGDIVTINVPAGDPDYEHISTCGGALTQSALSEPINVFASFLHAHEIGKAIWTDVIRDGQPVGQVAVDDPFDFNMQEFQDVDFTIQPGDTLETHCIYDSSDRETPTPGGPASDQEMCINFMMYYPKVTAETCGSI